MQRRRRPLDHEAAPLTATNLLSISAQVAQSDKGKLLHDFIESQRLYMSRYSTEGRAVTAAWDRNAAGGTTGTPPHKDCPKEILASAFDTPILKPRVPLVQGLDPISPPQDDTGTTAGGAIASRSNAKLSKASESKRVTARAEIQEENVPETGAKRQTKHGGQQEGEKQGRISKQQTLDRYTAKAKTEAKGMQLNNKRRRSPDSSGPEHTARLAERRERRRVKRSIVAPKAPDPASDERDGSSNGKQGVTKAKRKSKATSLAAGLALMHGFTAKNIGKNRLTTQPERRTGVFNKGKASAKVGTSTKRNAIFAAFSESQFLNKAERNSKRREEPLDETHPTSFGCSQDSESSAEEPIERRLRHRLAASKADTDEVAQHHPEHRHCEVSDNGQSATSQQPGNKRAASIVWDIEINGGSLPLGSDCTGMEKPEDGTIILNTQAQKWMDSTSKSTKSASNAEFVEKEKQMNRYEERAGSQVALEATVDHASAVSLRPSESASQLPHCVVSSTPQLHVSRFFAPLPVSPSACNHSKSLSAAEGEEALPSQLPSSPILVSCQASPDEDPMERSLPMDIDPSVISQAIRPVLLDTSPLTYMSPASISLSALEQELQALDADDHGLMYAARGQGSSTYRGQGGQFSVLSAPGAERDNPRLELYGPMHAADNTRLGSDPSALSLYIPETYVEWDDQSRYSVQQEEHLDYVMDPGTGTRICAEFDDGEGELEEWQDEAVLDEPMMVAESHISLDDALPYTDGESAADTLSCDSRLHELPTTYQREIHPTESQGSYVAEENFGAVDSIPQTASSWCSVTEDPEPAMISYSPSVIASEVSTELLVPNFAQGRDLLLGLSEHGGNRNPYSITSVEEDVARSLRGHWLPQRL
ncbi:hypothetical protein DAEQUDRAFT_809022 [Daedalea quercina L-15889]|uniref:Uncharacterized protein n=1 Tax=Daedalea quercina L-15889 TaxID=1314783 RepID=A0A165SW46_9APHY|nr:hypothetical protein DAEQUDRAFT_809022 [Daedalea quercina L-15889]